MAKRYEVSAATRAVNAFFSAMTRAGLGKSYRHILTVRGRRTGQFHSTPVDVMADDGHRWLVAGYGVANWVRNLRSAGEATLQRGRRLETVRATELDPADSVPVLRQYLAEVPVTRSYFDMTTDSPDDVAIAEASRHPVFEIRHAPTDATHRLRQGPSKRSTLWWVLIAVLVAHGAIHFLGAAKGLGLAQVDQLTEPIGDPLGVAWLIAGLGLITAAVAFARRTRGWWYIVAAAGVVSEAVILTSWSDARAGTAVNVLLILLAASGYLRNGPRSFAHEYRTRVDGLPRAPSAGVLTGDDLAALPEPVARYVRRSGSVGKPRVTDFRARIHGRIRGGPDKPWMRFTGEQVNTYAPDVRRLFLIDARMFGLPIDVLHVFETRATMRAKACGLVTLVDASGQDMDRGETVTVFNDLCVLAPGAIVDAPVRWSEFDEHHVRRWFTHGRHTVSAVLTFDDDGDLTDFVSDDRLRASPNGKAFTPLQWSTPLGRYATIQGRRLTTGGVATWHGPAPEGTFTYIEFEIDDISYNARSARIAHDGDEREVFAIPDRSAAGR